MACQFELMRLPIPKEAKEGMTLTKIGQQGVRQRRHRLLRLAGGRRWADLRHAPGRHAVRQRRDKMTPVYKQKLPVEWYQDYGPCRLHGQPGAGGKNI